MAASRKDNDDYLSRIKARSTIGHCFKCGAEFGRVAMCSHVLKEREKFGTAEECMILEITGMGSKGFWLVAEASADAKLADLDVFLRQVWMECCEHRSKFYPKGAKPWGRNDIPMLLNISDSPSAFSYIYDFGTTSGADIRMIGLSTREKCEGAIRLLARNDPIHPRCEVCGGDADNVAWDGAGETEYFALCDSCFKKHGDEDSFAPFTNSPRMGLCGYCGELDFFDYAPGAHMPESEKVTMESHSQYYDADDDYW